MKIRIGRGIEAQEALILLSFWGFTLIMRRITAVVMYVVGLIEYVEILNGFIWGILVLLTINVFFKIIKLSDIALIIAVTGFLFIASWIWPANYMISEQRLSVLITMIPSYLLGKTLGTHDGSIDKMRIISIAVVMLNTIVYFAYYLRGGGQGIVDDNLAFAYALLPHVLLLIYYYYIHKNLYNLIVAIASSLLLLTQGTRGPMLLGIVFVIWLLVYKNGFKKNILLTIVGGGIVGIVIWSDLYIRIIQWLRVVFARFGMGTRIFDMILQSGELLSSYWRNYIRVRIIDAVNQNKAIGLGPFGDRLVLKAAATDGNAQVYSHNIVLELVCDYGVAVGIAFIVILVLLMIKAYKKSNKTDDRILLVILIFCTVGKLIFSGSYLTEPLFYVAVGYMVSLATQKNEVLINEKGFNGMRNVLSVK